jgi:uncharacterized protein
MHGKNYDAKNMMHTFRLLDTAEEIAANKRIIVRREDTTELRKIRDGEYSYPELIEKARIKIERIQDLFGKSGLPDEPDCQYAEKALVSIRKRMYIENEKRFRA